MKRQWLVRAFCWILFGTFTLGFIFFHNGGQKVFAQNENDIDLSAQVGFDGFCKNSRWIPVYITVSNTGEDLDARIQVSYNNNRGEESINGIDISLPNTSHKEFFLYLYPQENIRELKLSLLVGEKELVKKYLRVTCLPEDNLLIGLLVDDPQTYTILNEIKTQGGFIRLAQLRPDELPDMPQGWDGLDGLIISGVDLGSLKPSQYSALQSWLTRGGKLLIVGGPKWQSSTTAIKDLLPIDLESTRVIDNISELQCYSVEAIPLDESGIVAVGKLHPDAEVLVEQEGYPLIAQRQIGLGIVYLLTFDPGLQPLTEWDGMKDLYSYLLDFQRPIPNWVNISWDYYSINRALSSLVELGIPPMLYICGWLITYVVIVGPINYFVLRRMKHSELAWLTIPALAIIFIFVAYFSGSLYRGTKPILNRLAVVQTWEGSDQAKVQALVGIFSPKRTKYTLGAEDQFIIYPYIDAYLQESDTWQSVQRGTNSIVPNIQIEIGGMKVVSVEGNFPAMTFDHNLELTINSKAPLLSGTLTNTSEFTLKDAILVTPGDVKKLGDLTPNSSHDVNVTLLAGKRGPEINTFDSMALLGIDNYFADMSEDSRRRFSLLETTLFADNYEQKSMWGIYIMGWVDEFMIPVTLEEEQQKEIDTTFYIAMLSPSVNLGTGDIYLPPSMFIWESSVDYASPYYTNISSYTQESYSIRFRPAVLINYNDVKSLKLHMETTADLEDVLVFLRDFREGGWVQVEISSWGNVEINEPDKFVGPHGEIELRIDCNQNKWIEIDLSNFTLVVEQ